MDSDSGPLEEGFSFQHGCFRYLCYISKRNSNLQIAAGMKRPMWTFGLLYAFHRHAKPLWNFGAFARKFGFNNKIQATAASISTFWLGKPSFTQNPLVFYTKSTKMRGNCPEMLESRQTAGAPKSARCTHLVTQGPTLQPCRVDAGNTYSALHAEGSQSQNLAIW